MEGLAKSEDLLPSIIATIIIIGVIYGHISWLLILKAKILLKRRNSYVYIWIL